MVALRQKIRDGDLDAYDFCRDRHCHAEDERDDEKSTMESAERKSWKHQVFLPPKILL